MRQLCVEFGFPALATLLASCTLAHSAVPPLRFYVFELATPTTPGTFRFRLTEAMVQRRTAEKAQNLKVFDADGQPLSCEFQASLPLKTFTKSYALHGDWLDDATAWKLPREDDFPFNSVWRFKVPDLAKGEFPLRLEFSWHSTIDGPVEMQVISEARNPNRRRLRTLLSQGQTTDEQVRLHLADNTPVQWPPFAELRFTLAADEQVVGSPTLITGQIRPWARQVDDERYWYVFDGNGRTPYRVQLGTSTEGCWTLGSSRNANVEDPNWPPEATVTREIPDAPMLGKDNSRR